MDFFETVTNRASVRAFVPCTISEADILRIVDAGLRAPTAFTVQPWHFLVVRDRAKLELLGKVQGCVAQAACAIVAVGDPCRSEFWREDLSAAVTQMHLAATALGHASLWVAVLNRELVSPVLQIPDKLVPLAILPLGKAAAPAKQAPRLPRAGIVHSESFGTPFQG